MSSKILFLLHLPPPVHGSSMIGEYIRNSSVINESFKCRYINLLASNKVSESGKINIRKILDFVKIFINIIKELFVQKPDLCYLALTVNGAAFYRDVIIVTLLKIFRIKRIYHLHSKGVQENSRNRFNSFFYKYVFEKANVILLSGYLYPDVKRFVREDRVHICPNGIPVEYKQFEAKRTNEIPKILFLSNLLISKGIFILLEACLLLKNRGISFKCDIVGGEGDIGKDQIESEIGRYQLNQQVVYHGRKYGKEKFKVYKSADIFAFPTYDETFGLVNLEAMQYGLPVVSTFEGGIPSVVTDGKTGFLIPTKDSEALASKLEILISNKELRKQMGEASRKKFEDEFTVEKFEERLFQILKTNSK